jgi:hypothetical protein
MRDQETFRFISNKTNFASPHLLVLYCLNHSGSFTLYPPGWMPYGRKSIDNLDMRGHFVVHESWNAKARWEETEFLAVTDAADGELWPIEGKLGPEITSPLYRLKVKAHGVDATQRTAALRLVAFGRGYGKFP